MELSEGDGEGAAAPPADGAPAGDGAGEGTAPALAPPGDALEDEADDAPPAGAADALAWGTALEAAEVELLAAGAALAGGGVDGVIGGAVKVPALDARLGSGSALFE